MRGTQCWNSERYVVNHVALVVVGCYEGFGLIMKRNGAETSCKVSRKTDQQSTSLYLIYDCPYVCLLKILHILEYTQGTHSRVREK